MKRQTYFFLLVLGFALVVTGCGKKSMDSSNLNGGASGGIGGFDSLASTDELAGLPQANPLGAVNQQGGIETLPIEAAPVTQVMNQGIDQTMQAVHQAASGMLDRAHDIQTALKNAGLYQGSVDGKIGPQTKRAIMAFQKQQGLKADGKVGPKTWKALEPFLTAQATADGNSQLGATVN